MSSERRTLIAGNWKMNGSRDQVAELLDGIAAGAGNFQHTDLAVFPPFVYLGQVANRLSGSAVRWGVQTVSEFADGAYTGEISTAMARDFSCHYVLLGHSERRTLFGETDAQIVAKLKTTLDADLTPVLCVGETLEQREADITEQVIGQQIDAVLTSGVSQADLSRLIVAYEPVWAIGTGKTATPEQAQQVHAMIRSKFATVDATIAGALQILYGGSLKAANADDLLQMPDIDGGLIGGASLDANEFLTIARSRG